MRFGLLLSEAVTGLRRNASMVISVVLVTFISLTFVGAAILMQMQVAQMRGFWSDRAQVAIYMCSTSSTTASCVNGVATDEQVTTVRDELASPAIAPLVRDSRFDTQEDAYQQFVDLVGDDYASVVTPDQLNQTFWLNLNDPQDSAAIIERFSNSPGVEEVTDQLEYLQPLFSALTVATYIAVGIAGLMLIAAVLLIATTIRLSAFARRRELGIMRLVGASNRFVQAPFILEGVVAAFIGSILASAAVIVGVRFGVTGYLRENAPFVTTWVGLRDVAVVVPIIMLIGVVLAALSSSFAIRRWLRN